MYLTHEEYTAMGGSIDAALFSRLEAKARRRIDAMTHGRLIGEEPAREAVKHCMFELVSAMQSDEAAAGLTGRGIASMSNDGVSVAFAAGDAQGGVQPGYARIVREWLLNETTEHGVSVLYAGVDV